MIIENIFLPFEVEAIPFSTKTVEDFSVTVKATYRTCRGFELFSGDATKFIDESHLLRNVQFLELGHTLVAKVDLESHHRLQLCYIDIKTFPL